MAVYQHEIYGESHRLRQMPKHQADRLELSSRQKPRKLDFGQENLPRDGSAFHRPIQSGAVCQKGLLLAQDLLPYSAQDFSREFGIPAKDAEK